jgi:tyrosyl-tRNA synthetase
LLFQTIRFAYAGFTILLVLGGATSKIGDPSDKLKERPKLEPEKIDEYQKKIKLQLEKVLIEPKKIGQLNHAPLELFYPKSPELLGNIYRILQINSQDEKHPQ